MQLKRCDQGHYFDPTKHSGCPHCGIKIDFDFLKPNPPVTPSSTGAAGGAGSGYDDRTVAMNPGGQAPARVTPPTPSAPTPGASSPPQNQGDDRTVAFQSTPQPTPGAQRPPAPTGFDSENRTVGIFRKKLGIEPVVGWLVCVEGADRGRDYRIISERNFIGRSEKMDISISGDETISRDGHAIISFNPKRNSYKLYPGESRGIVYLNDDEIVGATELKAYDIIEIGQTKLMFIPFCGENFQWS